MGSHRQTRTCDQQQACLKTDTQQDVCPRRVTEIRQTKKSPITRRKQTFASELKRPCSHIQNHWMSQLSWCTGQLSRVICKERKPDEMRQTEGPTQTSWANWSITLTLFSCWCQVFSLLSPNVEPILMLQMPVTPALAALNCCLEVELLHQLQQSHPQCVLVLGKCVVQIWCMPTGTSIWKHNPILMGGVVTTRAIA